MTIPSQMVRQMSLKKTALVYLGERKEKKEREREEGSRAITSRNAHYQTPLTPLSHLVDTVTGV